MEYTKINTLWSLENIIDDYIFNHQDMQIYNKKSNFRKTISIDSQGYCVVYLQCKDGTCKSVKYHKIIALSLIRNEPYELIEHLDDNKLNNDVSNLKFSNKRDNGLHAFENKKHVIHPSVFEFCLESGEIYKGTIREISKQSNIPEGTLYDYIYNGVNRSTTSKTKYRFRYINEIVVGDQRSQKFSCKI